LAIASAQDRARIRLGADPLSYVRPVAWRSGTTPPADDCQLPGGRSTCATPANDTLVGCVQTASTWNCVSLPLVLLTSANHSSGGPPMEELVIPELLMLTEVLVEVLTAPPPVTTIPAGHWATASCCVAVGKSVTSENV
jgi:hypothetical protein